MTKIKSGAVKIYQYARPRIKRVFTMGPKTAVDAIFILIPSGFVRPMYLKKEAYHPWSVAGPCFRVYSPVSIRAHASPSDQLGYAQSATRCENAGGENTATEAAVPT